MQLNVIQTNNEAHTSGFKLLIYDYLVEIQEIWITSNYNKDIKLLFIIVVELL